jgi:acyl-CoA dehydrogenase
VSLLLIERDTPGFTRTEARRWAGGRRTLPTLHFDNCRVPVRT